MMSTPLYKRIVASINPEVHEMKWSLDVTLPPPLNLGDTIWWKLHIVFIDWGDIHPSLRFLKQDSAESNEDYPVVEVPENEVPSSVINRYIRFFDDQH
jgi:hypothetical protein